MLCFGFAFLYIPIFLLIAYSFNDSRLISVWGGFSTRWYSALFANEQIIDAAMLSLRVAAIRATVATSCGTLAGRAVTRMGTFRGGLFCTGTVGVPQ